MFEKLARSAGLGVVAAAAGAAGVGVGAFALYAALKDPLGQAGAAAVVAVLFLLVAIVAMGMLRGGSKAKADDKPKGELISGGGVAGLKDRALTLARERPLVAGAVGVVGALYVLRNPALVSALVAGLVGRAEGKYEQRRSGWF
jgi:cytochrome b